MSLNKIFLIAKLTWITALKSKATLVLTLVLGIALFAATYIGWQNFKTQNDQRTKYKELVREKWLAKPDKHPHRMAHYGYLAFRPKHELSFFDFGIESFAGVSIFLEAHKQNTVNFSESSFSNGIIRFGEMSIAMILQVLVPLLIFFLGYKSISAERENGTLKILFCQGVKWSELLLGKISGIIAVSFVLFIPVICITILLWAMLSNWQVSSDASQRLLLLLTGYALYFIICSCLAVLVSAWHRTSRAALTVLVVLWVIFIVVLPKATQSLGTQLYPSPSKIEFNAAIEHDLSQQGDSHNPNDPHYEKFKKDILKKYKVDSVKQLSVNYGGLVMAEGERISAQIYQQHQNKLIQTYIKQNSFTRAAAFLNPYLAIKNLSMALTGADYANYLDFQQQTEKFRYELAQKMNALQIEHISNVKQGENDKPYTISHTYWSELPDFNYQFKTIAWVLKNEVSSVLALLTWFAVLITLLFTVTKRLKTL